MPVSDPLINMLNSDRACLCQTPYHVKFWQSTPVSFLFTSSNSDWAYLLQTFYLVWMHLSWPPYLVKLWLGRLPQPVQRSLQLCNVLFLHLALVQRLPPHTASHNENSAHCNACMYIHTNTHMHTHPGTHTHEHSEYTKPSLHSLKQAANRGFRWVRTAARNRKRGTVL